MIDLDKYVDHSIKMRVFGKELDVLEPSIQTVMAIEKIEADMTAENVNEKRVQTVELFLNHNKQGMKFTKDQIEKLPFEAISRIMAEVSAMRYESDHDPNSESQFPKEK